MMMEIMLIKLVCLMMLSKDDTIDVEISKGNIVKASRYSIQSIEK